MSAGEHGRRKSEVPVFSEQGRLAHCPPLPKRASLLNQCSIPLGNVQEAGPRIPVALPSHPARQKARISPFQQAERFSGFGFQQHEDDWRLLTKDQSSHRKLPLSGIGGIRIRGKLFAPKEPRRYEIFLSGGKWHASVTTRCRPLPRAWSWCCGFRVGQGAVPNQRLIEDREKRAGRFRGNQ